MKKEYQILIIFGTNIPDTTRHQTRAGFRVGERGAGLPPTGGLPPNPSIFQVDVC